MNKKTHTIASSLAVFLGVLIGFYLVVFKPFVPGSTSTRRDLGITLLLLALGGALSVIGVFRQRTSILVGGIGVTASAMLLLGETERIVVPHAFLLSTIMGFMFGVDAFIRSRSQDSPRSKSLSGDSLVLFSFLVGGYSIYLNWNQIILVLLVFLGVLLPSLIYILRREKLNDH